MLQSKTGLKADVAKYNFIFECYVFFCLNILSRKNAVVRQV